MASKKSSTQRVRLQGDGTVEGLALLTATAEVLGTSAGKVIIDALDTYVGSLDTTNRNLIRQMAALRIRAASRRREN